MTFVSSTKGILWLLAIASALILSAALIGQYGFALAPCELCMLQRYPYILIIALASLAAVLPLPEKARFVVIILCILLLLIDGGIAFYHAGVELQWFPGPDACSAKGSAGQTLEEMRRQIMEAPLVSCDQAMAHVFGLSLAAWNAIIALLLAVSGAFLLRKNRAR